MSFFKKYKLSLIFSIFTLIIYLINPNNGRSIVTFALKDLKTMLLTIPPIFIIIGLMDVWIEKETMIKHMGHDSGIKGIFWTFLLGTIGAGPTYGAFPVAALLIRKGARIAYAIFFLGIWSAVKLPMVIFEATAMGSKFTLIHIFTMITTYLIGSFVLEKFLTKKDREDLILTVKSF
ncbi:MAG: permease [Fusobacteriaceae bacterium]|nr:permease [Fusobacteriaceae bacterium]